MSAEKNDHKNMIVGLTGGIGSGKSTAASYLTEAGLIHVDADLISHQLTEKIPGEDNPVLIEIGQVFGGEVLHQDGSLDRAGMAALVFSDPAKKQALEDILFREIRAEIDRQIEAAGDAPVLLDVPLLFESGLDRICDHIILISADLDVRLDRVTLRDGCSREDVLARIRNQMPEDEKKALADFVVDNSGTTEELFLQLDQVLEEIGL